MLTLQPASLDWALQHALRYGDTDLFPKPFEYEAIQYDWDNVRDYLTSQDVTRWHVRPHRSLLAPKAKFGFRIVTQLDPLDFLVLAATVRELAADLEARRVSTSRNIVFSYRVAPAADGRLFDPTIRYSDFLITARDLVHADPTVTHIALTDIADFYPRIYHHRLEGALAVATGKSSHVVTVRKLLSGWNGTETFGIPVGSAPTRLLAEVAIADVDEALLAAGVRFVRYNDDYRMLATSYSEAYRHLAFLAETLYRNHGLTLQEQKTHVVTVEAFLEQYVSTPAQRELASLRSRFEAIVEGLGLEKPYDTIDYDELKPDQQALVDSLNLVELFQEELASGSPELPIIRFVIRRMAQLGDDSILNDLLAHLEVFHPLFPEIIKYLTALTALTASTRAIIGGRILDLVEDSIVSQLPYHRMWALELFTRSTDWNQADRFFNLLATIPDLSGRRKLILAMGRASQRHWFQSQWRNLFDESAWPRRALIAAASCMPADARRHWYRSIEDRLDVLETAVMRWARNAPFIP